MAKENKKFMILSAIGIIMVVDSHTWGTFNLFANFFPFNSFFMPMFVLISGYFNRVDNKTNLWKYTLKKVKTLLIPYWVVSALAILLEWLMLCYKTEAIQPFLFDYRAKAFLNTFTSGEITTIALPMWFAPMLFAVQVVYAIMKKFLYKIWNSKIIIVLFAACHIWVVWYAKGHDLNEKLLLPLKVLFFLVFIEMGILYRDVLEEKLKKANHLLLLSILLMINMIRIMIMPNEYDVAFDSLGTLTGFTSPYAVTPLISAIVGMLFWIEVVDLIGKPFYNSKVVNAISENTFYIMSLHIVFFNILNCILFTINKFKALPYFDIETFQESNWYRWEYVQQFRYLYFLFGVLGPVGLIMLYDRFIKKPALKLIKGNKAKTGKDKT
ncbi:MULTISPECIES: acyltransferase family protein [Ruminococcus]|uniref:Fucose 4-O-acetylase n=1 Tax=Ruminococcus flavefaciens TaxID=1265 RepID=A0A1M7I121_RUMFL|nr:MULTISPECIES: acyltransferase family protein [Ruminococcus]MCR4796457.1 acyltransferase family protein [Ruminococcus sp.]SHM34415.1 Fucose 4-O-acetylase [Ruminococcus flavefaciens]